jgi:AcrR family transcriptional regulator
MSANTGKTTDTELTPAGRRILDSATDLFYAYGIRAIGVEAIAEHAGVTKKTIYDRFGSKDELIAAYLERRDRQWHELIERDVERNELSPRDRILAMFEIMEHEIRKRGCGFINAFAEMGEVDHPAAAIARRQKRWTRDYFLDLARQAGARDPESLASQLLMLHEGAYITYAMVDDLNAAMRARDAAETLFDAALAQPSS